MMFGLNYNNKKYMDQKQNLLSVPIAIVAAGIIIAGAIFITKSPNDKEITEKETVQAPAGKSLSIPPVSSSDHLLGNPNAPIQIIEYSDYECYFCDRFFPTYKKLVENYGKKGDLVWIYRHSPIRQSHPNAEKAALAAECAAEIGGNAKFWEYTDYIFENNDPQTASLSKFDFSNAAKNIGLDKNNFDECLSAKRGLAKISADEKGGFQAGVDGTPSNFIVLKKPLSEKLASDITSQTADLIDQTGQRLVNIDNSRKIIATFGALPYDIFDQIISAILVEQKP